MVRCHQYSTSAESSCGTRTGPIKNPSKDFDDRHTDPQISQPGASPSSAPHSLNPVHISFGPHLPNLLPEAPLHRVSSPPWHPHTPIPPSHHSPHTHLSVYNTLIPPPSSRRHHPAAPVPLLTNPVSGNFFPCPHPPDNRQPISLNSGHPTLDRQPAILPLITNPAEHFLDLGTFGPLLEPS